MDRTAVARATDFATDPTAVVVELIRAAPGPLSTRMIQAGLVAAGIPIEAVRSVWASVKRRLKADPRLIVDGHSHRWRSTGIEPPVAPAPRSRRTAAPGPARPPRTRQTAADKLAALRRLSPDEALDRLLAGRLRPAEKDAIAEAIRAGLATPRRSNDEPTVRRSDDGAAAAQRPDENAVFAIGAQPRPAESAPVQRRLDELVAEKTRLEAMLRETHQQQVSFRALQDRQLKIDVMRALAELASEVEELTVDGAEPDVVVERVRIAAELHSLQPIGQAGQRIAFDPTRHSPLAGFPDAGSSVSVIRPGYTWHADGEDVLLTKAVVA